jgi:NadR type nicotinamide-nucleotide adenylyltransferase
MTEVETDLRRIAITGPESTGKSLLARQLASHYSTVFVPELARSYIDSLGRPYQESDITEIARGQLRMEQEVEAKANTYLFCDTELIVTKIWSLHKYGSCDPFILDNILNGRYDLYLLCDIDLPWEQDPQREHPHLRKFFFDWYKRELDGYGFRYEVVCGMGRQRLERAIGYVDSLIV